MAAESKKLLGIEAGRGIAAMLVVVYHCARHLKADFGYLPMGGIAHFGHAGVDFFFVLSGFIIYYVHAQDVGRPARCGHYFKQRFTRVYPLYWIVLLATLVLASLSSHRSMPSLLDGFNSFLLLPQDKDPIVGVAWTLEHEILFYLVFSIGILHRSAGRVLLAAWAALIAVAAVGALPHDLPVWVRKLATSFNAEFFMGMLAARLIIDGRARFALPCLVAGVAGFLAAGACEDLGWMDGYAATARIWYGVPSMLMVIGLVQLERGNRLRIPGFLASAGRASYAIYLVHLIAIGIGYKLLLVSGMLAILPLWVTYILLSAAAIAAGMVVSQLVEYPLMGRVRSWLAGRPERRPVSA